MFYIQSLILIITYIHHGQSLSTFENKTINETQRMMNSVNSLETCSVDLSRGINVTSRASSSFSALITYNCSSIDSYELTVIFNDTSYPFCYISPSQYLQYSTILSVTCSGIYNKAGRNWTFSLVQQSIYNNHFILNKTLQISLEPKSINSYISGIRFHQNESTVLVSVQNCLEISDPKYLVVQCNSSEPSSIVNSNNCTYIYTNLQPGIEANIVFIRLPIPIIDTIGQEFPKESIFKLDKIDLDKVTNFSFHSHPNTKTKAIIYFDRPNGDYDQISLSCNATDRTYCYSAIQLTNSTMNCLSCNNIMIYPILRGVTYQCQAQTIKQYFTSVLSDPWNFTTPLEPVLYNISNSSFSNRMEFSLTKQSDYSSLELVCDGSVYSPFICSNLTKQTSSCYNTLNYIDGSPGCNYQCVFITKKINYIDRSTDKFQLVFAHPRPTVYRDREGSRWISVSWSVYTTRNIHSFYLYKNQSWERTVGASTFTYNFTYLYPNQYYLIYIILNSNVQVVSNSIYVLTEKEAPPRPSEYDISTKIIPQEFHILSTSEQFVIDIYRSLFSNTYGDIQYLKIYVRQDQYNYASEPYYEARQNPSIDYLAIQIIINSYTESKIRILLGNETNCYYYSRCNGKLKPNTEYKILVGGCITYSECTYVLSKSFQTKQQEQSSKLWLIIFPLVFVVIIVVILIWKRKELKACASRKRKKKYVQSNVEPSAPSLFEYQISAKNPKLLIEYTGLTDEDQIKFQNEFQELKTSVPFYDPSIEPYTNILLDRYYDIPSRGPWSQTAVRLTNPHRSHDYINGNEIQGVRSNKDYLACQNPLKDTCEDFWDMIVQYKIMKIVMLNKLEDAHYVPVHKKQRLNIGKYEIETERIEYKMKNQLEVRYLNLREGEKQYDIRHYLFIAWTEMEIIKSEKLIDLIQIVNQTKSIVVHCGSGTGRTGTYITVDIIIQLINRSIDSLSTMKLDVMGIVNQLRQERINMVKTTEQYLLIHECIEEYLRKINQLNNIQRISNAYEAIAEPTNDEENAPTYYSL